MSLKPTGHIQNMHPGSRVGVEMEICLDRKKYEKLGFYEDEGSQSYKTPTYQFKGESPFKVGYPEEPGQPDLSNILLLTDPTCMCEEKFINAEIVSPKMDSVEIPHYLNFLKTKVFNNMKEVYQGETCGIHVHWSNSDMDKYVNDLNYKFLFFKLMHNLRQKLDYKLINPIFSGREHFYTEDLEKRFQIMIPSDFFGENVRIVSDSSITIQNYQTKSLIDITGDVNSAMITYIEPSAQLKSYKSQMTFLEEFLLEKVNKDYTVLLNEVVLKRKQTYNKLYSSHDFHLKDIKEIIEFIKKSDEKQHLEAVKNILKYVKTYKKNRDRTFLHMDDSDGGFDFNSEEQEIRHEFDSIVREVNKIIGESKKYADDLYMFAERLDTLKLFIGEEGSNYKNIHLLDIQALFRDKEELILEKKKRIMEVKRVTPENVFEFLLMFNKKLPDLSFYDIEDGFHMEMRMYSLDTVFYKRKATADDLLNEITKFILYTENLMMNVIAILNEVYSPSERNGIKPKYQAFVDKVLLYGNYHTKAQQKKIFKNLFGKEEVDRSTQRNTKSVRKHSLSLRKNSKNSKSKTRKLSRRNSFNSSEEVRSAYKEYLRTMPDSE